jgi:2,3-diketo-5-methylthio-1-phosphopentane phosphatase
MSKARPKVYLLDVEGTVAPLSLTTEVLFPYARARFAEFLNTHSGDASAQADLVMLAKENSKETDPHSPRVCPPERSRWRESATGAAEGSAFREAVLAYLLWLMDRDRKSTALKSLQGKIWKAGFESGELKGTLFEDVPDAFRRWSAEARVAIYSSGSVEAQKLFFRYSTAGDLTPLIAAYFDTRTGPKMESASYTAITAEMRLAPPEMLFCSDSVRELNAARAAGCGTRLVVRPGNAPVDDAHGHTAIESFAGI